MPAGTLSPAAASSCLSLRADNKHIVVYMVSVSNLYRFGLCPHASRHGHASGNGVARCCPFIGTDPD